MKLYSSCVLEGYWSCVVTHILKPEKMPWEDDGPETDEAMLDRIAALQKARPANFIIYGVPSDGEAFFDEMDDASYMTRYIFYPIGIEYTGSRFVLSVKTNVMPLPENLPYPHNEITNVSVKRSLFGGLVLWFQTETFIDEEKAIINEFGDPWADEDEDERDDLRKRILDLDEDLYSTTHNIFVVTDWKAWNEYCHQWLKDAGLEYEVNRMVKMWAGQVIHEGLASMIRDECEDRWGFIPAEYQKYAKKT